MTVMSVFRLLPGLRRVRLHDTAVQFGANPERAMLLRLPDKRFGDLVDHLETWTDESSYARMVRKLGILQSDADQLLHQLREAGFILDGSALTPDGAPGSKRPVLSTEATALALRRQASPGPVLARRQQERVFINSSGLLAHRTAQILRESEIGRVWCADEGRRGKATLTVLVNSVQPPALLARAHHRRQLPYLIVTIVDGEVELGPLVRPGISACVRCVELRRWEAMPQWRHAPVPAGDGDLIEATLRAATVSALSSIIAQYADGERASLQGTTVRISPSLESVRSQWQPHPDCGCLS